jgi:phosphoribosylaminoimidazole-succinocarboxamide synthase
VKIYKKGVIMRRLDLLYEGKAKRVFKTDDPDLYLIEFKDDITAFNGLKKDTISGKGALNNKISSVLFKILESKGIPTHYVKMQSDREMLVKKVEILPIEVVARNYAAGSLSKRLGLEEGRKLIPEVLEFYYKSDELGDPMINEYHIETMKVASKEEIVTIKNLSFRINDILSEYFLLKDIILVDFKMEFGRYHGNIVLADEISPDTCRFWDRRTMEKLDKDRFRRALGDVKNAYVEILKRVGGN